MKKNIKKILIIIILMAGLSLADGVLAQISSDKAFVIQAKADNITQISATLRGWGGLNPASNLLSSLTSLLSPMTAYFRYSTSANPPIFCNDIYGANMISTKDIKLGLENHNARNENGNYYYGDSGVNSFYQNITNLIPNTTYYYCAIISNKEKIGYDGIVEKFHTNCLDTTIETKVATNVRSSSVRLNGSYCSMRPNGVKTYFKYR